MSMSIGVSSLYPILQGHVDVRSEWGIQHAVDSQGGRLRLSFCIDRVLLVESRESLLPGTLPCQILFIISFQSGSGILLLDQLEE